MQNDTEKTERLNFVSGQILDAAIEVHRELGGPGLLEAVYEEALAHELKLRGLVVARQVCVPVEYKGHQIKQPLILDLFVNKEVIIEVKSVVKLNQVYSSQLLTYLRMMNKPLGLLINFGEQYLKHGFHRVVNNFP